jgi:predicted methyltransferase
MHLTVEAQRRCLSALYPGAVAIDATAGNGLDTQFLAQHVGATGRVYAIDLQPAAIERVVARLNETGQSQWVQCMVADHSRLEQLVAPEHAGRVACAVFNLGYLPLSDKSIATSAASTIPAIDAASRLLEPGGHLSILAYVGHQGGAEESAAVENWVAAHSGEFQFEKLFDANNPQSPVLWSLRRRAGNGTATNPGSE